MSAKFVLPSIIVRLVRLVMHLASMWTEQTAESKLEKKKICTAASEQTLYSCFRMQLLP